jgi:hypothetical protein
MKNENVPFPDDRLKDQLRHEMNKAIPAAIIQQIQESYAVLNYTHLDGDPLKPLVTAMLQNPNAMRELFDQYIMARDAVAELSSLAKTPAQQSAA